MFADASSSSTAPTPPENIERQLFTEFNFKRLSTGGRVRLHKRFLRQTPAARLQLGKWGTPRAGFYHPSVRMAQPVPEAESVDDMRSHSEPGTSSASHPTALPTRWGEVDNTDSDLGFGDGTESGDDEPGPRVGPNFQATIPALLSCAGARNGPWPSRF